MQNMSALGYCPNCREAMITENGVPKCFNCMPSKASKRVVQFDDPGEKAMGNVPKGLPNRKERTPPVLGKTVQDALTIMKSLAMPDDIKQFKQIKKIIKQLEALVGE